MKLQGFFYTKEMIREKILLNKDIIDTVEQLTSEQAGKLFQHILEYANGEVKELEDKILRLVFIQIKLDMLEDNVSLKPTYVYCIELVSSDESFIKIGISYEYKNRFKQFNSVGYNVKEIFIEKFGNRKAAEYREYCLHQKYSNARYRPKNQFAGHTECFNIESLIEIKKEVSNV